jgi:hypothetical protein
MPRVRAWRYVDEARTHDVQAWIETDHPHLRYVVHESLLGDDDPHDAHTDKHPISSPWEATIHQADLEARLALLGKYVVHDSARPGWVPLRPTLVGKSLDLEPLRIPERPPAIEFHHYQRLDALRAVTLLGVAQETPAGTRHLLARLDYRFPEVEGGNLRVVHPRLPPPVYRSLLAAQHLELHALEFRKTGEGIRADPQGWAALRATLDAILSRLLEGSSKDPTKRRPEMDATQKALLAAAGASKGPRTYEVEDENAGPSSAVTGPRPKAMIDELDPGIMDALQNPKLLALHARWLAPGESEKLQKGGERVIRAAVNKLRGTVAPHDQHLLSLLEASLLVRAALTNHVRIDTETLGRIKHAGAWL